MRLTPIGSEFESIIAAVIFFFVGGILSFVFCFAITNMFLCYKRHVLKRHRHNNNVDDFDYTVLTVDNSSNVVSPSEVVVVDAGRLEKSRTYTDYAKQKRVSNGSVNSSLSTSSTNET